MNDLDISTIQSNLDEIEDIFPEVMGYYFDLMFEKFPAIEECFQNVDVEKNLKVTSKTIKYVVENFENKNKVAANLINLGKKLSGLQIKKEQYVCFIDSFLLTLEHFFLDHWNEKTKNEWKKLIIFIMSCLVNGMKE